MSTRARQKGETRQRILGAAARRLREQGLAGISIGPVMASAGLTHGTFYAHFESAEELACEAFRHAISESQPNWLQRKDRSWRARIRRLARSYLSPAHRAEPGDGCPIGALASDIKSAPAALRTEFGDAIAATLDEICEGNRDNARDADAIALLALCVGGINLSRATSDDQLSRQILEVCRDSIETIVASRS